MTNPNSSSKFTRDRPDSNSAFTFSTTLLARIRQHDTQAWQRLTDIYGALVYQWCRKMGLSPEDSADVLQETFLSVAQSISRFRPNEQGGGFRAWLATITRNKIVDLWRKRKQNQPAKGGSTMQYRLQQFPEPIIPDDDDTMASETSGILVRALDLMKTDFEETTWRAFWHMTIEHQSAAEVAERLGISVNAVYKAKARVLHRMRCELGDLDTF